MFLKEWIGNAVSKSNISEVLYVSLYRIWLTFLEIELKYLHATSPGKVAAHFKKQHYAHMVRFFKD